MNRSLGFEACARAAVVCTSMMGGCGGDGAGDVVANETALSFSAMLDSEPSESADALIVWSVSSGQPDYLYVWGKAAVQNKSFRLDLRKRPPADAMNRHGVGVGYVVIAPRSTQLTDGRLADDDSLFETSIGASERQAIIYADHAALNAVIDEMRGELSAEDLKKAEGHWLFDFPPGYSCGEGRDAEPGETFDSFVPVDCTKLEVKLGDLSEFDFPNWT